MKRKKFRHLVRWSFWIETGFWCNDLWAQKAWLLISCRLYPALAWPCTWRSSNVVYRVTWILIRSTFSFSIPPSRYDRASQVRVRLLPTERGRNQEPSLYYRTRISSAGNIELLDNLVRLFHFSLASYHVQKYIFCHLPVQFQSWLQWSWSILLSSLLEAWSTLGIYSLATLPYIYTSLKKRSVQLHALVSAFNSHGGPVDVVRPRSGQWYD